MMINVARRQLSGERAPRPRCSSNQVESQRSSTCSVGERNPADSSVLMSLFRYMSRWASIVIIQQLFHITRIKVLILRNCFHRMQSSPQVLNVDSSQQAMLEGHLLARWHLAQLWLSSALVTKLIQVVWHLEVLAGD